MEKTCEFCGSPRPIIYCQADTAFLCLSCDAKVHSANALSGRHSRTLLCDSCRQNPAHVRCLDHSMLLCRECESGFHGLFSAHKKLMISSFTGCPSAKHFASLWGFDVNQVDKKTSNDQQRQNNSLIMQHVIDLKKLQLNEDDNQSSLLHGDGEVISKGLDCFTNDLQSYDNPNQELNEERFPSTISQMDHLSCSSSVGDPFWQYKNPIDNNQFWNQNLQDIGVCQEPGDDFDDFNIPDVDATFRNFEDIFPGDLEFTPTHDMMWSEFEKEASIDDSGHNYTKSREDVSGASSISISNNNINPKKESKQYDHVSHGLSRSMEYSPHLIIRSSCSPSFSRSRFSVESNGNDCLLDSAHSGRREKMSKNRAQGQSTGNEGSMRMSKNRKKARLQGRQTQLAPRKAKTDTHKRVKGRFLNAEGYESNEVKLTKRWQVKRLVGQEMRHTMGRRISTGIKKTAQL